jgi:histidyl-tRNA synthetase
MWTFALSDCWKSEPGTVLSGMAMKKSARLRLRSADLFSRAVGDTTDIVEKEMYLFEDRGGRPLALRPEGTAGVVRAYLEHGWDQTSPVKKLWYGGPMFRAERPQAGRYREFWQIGGESFGNPSPQADAETLLLVRDILTGAGLSNGIRFLVNSIGCGACRPLYREALKGYLSARLSDLCENCVRRLERNPLRALDCKIDGPKFADAPKMADHLCEACRVHRDEVYGLLKAIHFFRVRRSAPFGSGSGLLHPHRV